MKTVSPQTAEIYKLLNQGRALSAQEIAKRLEILPNAVYRVTRKLMDLGMIEELDGYPARFQALPAQTALGLYLVVAGQNFKREFGLSNPATNKQESGPTISLIKDRPALLRREVAELAHTRQSVDFVVSGHAVPDETMFAFRKATIKGVEVRMIIHQPEQARSKQPGLWKEIGAEVRYLPDFDMRLFIYDRRVTYLTSYDAKKPGSAFGVRFDYVPLALQMSEVFEQNWLKAREL